jgi:hypothetical protein
MIKALEVIPLILQRVERLVLNVPPRPSAPRSLSKIPWRQVQVRHPGPLALLGLRVGFHTLQEVDAHLLIGFVQAQVFNEQVTAGRPCVGLNLPRHLDLIRPQPLVDLLKQVLVVSRLDPQDEMAPGRLQVADVRRVATQAILGDDDRQMRMVPAEAFEPAACGVAFTVILALAILALDGLRGQGDDLRKIRVDDDRPQQLVVVGNLAVSVRAAQAVVAVDLLGAEVFHAVQRHQVAAVEEDVLLQDLAAL